MRAATTFTTVMVVGFITSDRFRNDLSGAPGGPGDRNATRWILDDRTLHGGHPAFAGGSQRDIAALETVLIASPAGDDGPSFADREERSDVGDARERAERLSWPCPPDPETWVMGNGNNYIDAGESLHRSRAGYFTSIINSNGDLVYFFHSSRIGTVMGRFSADKTWDLWTANGWSNADDTVPIAIDHAAGIYRRLKVYNHPDNPGELLGVASRRGIRGGTGEFNVHGFASSFWFNGNDFVQWTDGAVYDDLFATALIRSFEHDESDFAFDPVGTTGILVGTIGDSLVGFHTQLTATQYRHDDPAQRWHRWSSNGWHTTNMWPPFWDPPACRDVFILDQGEDVYRRVEHRHPRITHLPGTGDYLVTFDVRTAEVNTSGVLVWSDFWLTACRYDAAASTWSWWNGTSWEQGGTYAYGEIAPGRKSTEYRQQVLWNGDKVVIVLNEPPSVPQDPTGELLEVIYDAQSASFTGPAFLRNAAKPRDGDSKFCLAVDSAGTLWLAYTSVSGDQIRLRCKEPGGTWNELPDAVFSRTDSLSPVGVNFVGTNGEPVIFVLEIDDDSSPETTRLFAIAPPDSTVWDDEVVRVPAPPPDPVPLSDNPDGLTWVSTVQNKAPLITTNGWVGNGPPGSMGVDRDGYVYTGNYGDTPVIVHAPPDSGGTNRAWGYDWDHFGFPGGAAVDDQGAAVDDWRAKVYITDRLVAGGGGNLTSSGCVKIWERERRDQSYGWGSNVPAYFNREYYPSVLYHPDNANAFAWPADVAVDEGRSLLYVTNGLRNRVDVFDIENLVDITDPFDREGLFEKSISSNGLPYVRQLVIALIDNGYLREEPNDRQLTWNPEAELEGEGNVVPFLKAHDAFTNGLQLLPDHYEDDTDFTRNVYEQFKSKHDRPVYCRSFGAAGHGDGELMFPRGIDVDEDGSVYVVDCENHRIQKWDLDTNGATNCQDYSFTFSFSWGGLGRGEGEFLYPLALAVDDGHDRVYVTDPLNARGDLLTGRVQVFDRSGNFQYEWSCWQAGGSTVDPAHLAGIAVDERGSVFLGAGTKLVRFRLPDDPPELTVNWAAPPPPACSVVGYGNALLFGTATDDWGIDHINLTVSTNGGDVWNRDYPAGQGDFVLDWQLDPSVVAGTGGRLRVTAYDTIGQQASLCIRVLLGGLGTFDDADTDGVDSDCDNCPNDPNANQEDCDQDCIGDVCAIGSGQGFDCQPNGVPDECDIVGGTGNDCNDNGVPDECDIAGGTSPDADSNGVPDECDVDCQPNGIADELDLAGGTSRDCNGNSVPDECDISGGTSGDCNTNAIPDECEVVAIRLPFTNPAPLNANAGTDSGDDVNPQVTSDGAGHWVAVWGSTENLGGNIGTDRDILVARSTDDGVTWTDPEPLNNNAGTDSGTDEAPQVTTDGAGRWLAVWQSFDTLGGTLGDDPDILVARSTDNGVTWTNPEPLNNNATTDWGWDEAPQVTTDRAGNWVAVWTSYDSLDGSIGTDADILVARSPDNGATWTDPQPLNNNAATDWGADRSPQVGTDGAGNWVAVWQSLDDLSGAIGFDRDILVAHSVDNGVTWSNPEPLNNNAYTDSGGDYNPQVTSDGGNRWVAVWRSNDSLGVTIPHARSRTAVPDIAGDADVLVARSLDSGATWTDPQPLNNNASTDSGSDRYPQVATDGTGNWVAVWQSTDALLRALGSDWDLLVARSIDNGVTWTDPLPLNNDAGTDSYDDHRPQVATDGAGHWLAVWYSFDAQGRMPPPYPLDTDVLTTRTLVADCNTNGVPDECEIDAGTTGDCNGNDIPDECDMDAGASHDCNANAFPDECDVAGSTSEDCNSNGVPDECDLAGGTSRDCNINAVPDECDIAVYMSVDANTNGIPDECEDFCYDCNINGIPDIAEIAAGSAADTDGDGVPDACDKSDAARTINFGDFSTGDIHGQHGWWQAPNQNPWGPEIFGPITVATGSPMNTGNALKISPADPNSYPPQMRLRPQMAGSPIFQFPEHGVEEWGATVAIEAGPGFEDWAAFEITDFCAHGSAAGSGLETPTAVHGINTGVLFSSEPQANGGPDEYTMYTWSLDAAMNPVHRPFQPLQGQSTAELSWSPGEVNVVTIRIFNSIGRVEVVWNGKLVEHAASEMGCGDGSGVDRQTLLRTHQGDTTVWFDDITYSFDEDCDYDTLVDSEYIARAEGFGFEVDKNNDGIVDHCQDCNDDCTWTDPLQRVVSDISCLDPEELAGGVPDCNSNGIPDDCDIDPSLPIYGNAGNQYHTRLGGGSADCTANGVPDECEPMDFDTNGVVDLYDFFGFQWCFCATNNENGCLDSFDRVHDCGIIDLNDYAVFASQLAGAGAGQEITVGCPGLSAEVPPCGDPSPR